MATVTLQQREALPASYPDLGSPSPLSPAAQALDPAEVWQRLEAYIAHRFTEREVVWVVEGPGEWHPPLRPAAITSTEVWSGADAWEEVGLPPAPLGGYFLPGTGPYRFVAEVGGGSPAPEVPAALLGAFRRLAEYMAAPARTAGTTRESTSVGSLTVQRSYSASWQAEALLNSGAADLLRQYRRAT